jgi:hypothetical protein
MRWTPGGSSDDVKDRRDDTSGGGGFQLGGLHLGLESSVNPMSTIEEVKVADKRMREAQTALLAYAERSDSDHSDSERQDRDKHRLLADALIEATNEYIKLVLALNSK